MLLERLFFDKLFLFSFLSATLSLVALIEVLNSFHESLQLLVSLRCKDLELRKVDQLVFDLHAFLGGLLRNAEFVIKTILSNAYYLREERRGELAHFPALRRLSKESIDSPDRLAKCAIKMVFNAIVCSE